MHAALIVIDMYLQLYVVRKSYAHAFAHTLKLIDININQPHLFWVTAGYRIAGNSDGEKF